MLIAGIQEALHALPCVKTSVADPKGDMSVLVETAAEAEEEVVVTALLCVGVDDTVEVAASLTTVTAAGLGNASTLLKQTTAYHITRALKRKVGDIESNEMSVSKGPAFEKGARSTRCEKE